MAERGTKAKKAPARKPAGKRAPAKKAPAKKPAKKRAPAKKLTVAVTGPTGDIGLATLRALSASPKVGKVIGMARRPFDPAEEGLGKKVVYQQGDVLERESVERLVDGADVVIHLAFIIIGDPADAQRVNVEGSRNVFEAAVAAGAKRLVYTSSVAAYGFHADNPQPLTEDVEPRGSEGFYYSAHKAELEGLLDDIVAGSKTDAYVFRPSIVAGAGAVTLVESMLAQLAPARRIPLVGRAIEELPFLAPVLPDPGVPFQLVHHDDVAAALLAAVQGKGEPGRYNLAAQGTIKVSNLARSVGWWSVPVPGAVVGPLDELLSRVPRLPPEVAWLTAMRVPVLMDCAKARTELGWAPDHDVEATLKATVQGAREQGLL